jgi:A/G-specific adenine glycosylase
VTSRLSGFLLSWYAENERDIPWRDCKDPYLIWVSEIMLQQTRVETVIPYYMRWIEQFPDTASLAAASQQAVLVAWEGLGYYNRARNLHRAAQIVVSEHNGEVPREVEQLRKLPGVGRYTAGAIASIAFGQDEPVLDGNVSRVLARVYNLSLPLKSREAEEFLWERARENLPAGQAGDYNQALMDLGATICTPREPACTICPLSALCQASQLGLQDERPVVLTKPTLPHYQVTAAVITRQDQVLITRRPQNGLLGGMWEFPGGKVQPGEDLTACLQREICEELNAEIEVGSALGTYRHAYTHFRVTLHAFACRLKNGAQPTPVQVDDLRWVELDELQDYPMGKIDRQISNQLLMERYS